MSGVYQTPRTMLKKASVGLFYERELTMKT
jgi:hypothetical protein